MSKASKFGAARSLPRPTIEARAVSSILSELVAEVTDEGNLQVFDVRINAEAALALAAWIEEHFTEAPETLPRESQTPVGEAEGNIF